MQEKVEYEISPKGRFSFGLAEAWDRRELLYFYVWRGVKVRYKQAALGVAWAVLQPLGLMLVFTLLFKKGIRLDTAPLPYPVFSFAGLVLWQFFNLGAIHSATSIAANAQIIRKIYLPKLVFPISAIGVAAFDLLFAFAVLVGLALWHGLPGNFGSFAMLGSLALLLLVLATTGLGMLLAAFHVRFKDFQYVIPFMLQIMLFLSPIIYPKAALGNGGWTALLDCNPISGPVLLLRAGLGNGQVPWEQVGYSALTTVALLGLGLFSFRKMEAYFADLV
jgi:lipopolysaccharide transport system permease protein